jgi:hypothetical protein
MKVKAEEDRNGVGDRGFSCRKCGGKQFSVVYTRASPGAKVIRRRECRRCKTRFTTWEKAIGGPADLETNP